MRWGVPKIHPVCKQSSGSLQNMAPRGKKLSGLFSPCWNKLSRPAENEQFLKHSQCQHIQKCLHEMLPRNVSHASGSITASTCLLLHYYTILHQRTSAPSLCIIILTCAHAAKPKSWSAKSYQAKVRSTMNIATGRFRDEHGRHIILQQLHPSCFYS